jgi:hypothetical protein
MGMRLVRLLYLLEDAFVCLVKAFGQFLEDRLDAWGEAVAQGFQLAEYPSEPIMLFLENVP